MTKIWIITLFPDYFKPLIQWGVVGRSFTQSQFELAFINPRDFAFNRYKSVDDYPYGGGPGMVLRADIMKEALIKGVGGSLGIGEDLAEFKQKFWVIYPSPRGRVWNVEECQKMAARIRPELELENGQRELVFICGRYEGLDERFIQKYVDEEICLGNYILSGGELAVMTILDSTLRYVPGILGNEKCPHQESFNDSLLEAPQYTRPRMFESLEVPEILLSGHHAKIEEFNQMERLRLTQNMRPDLWEIYGGGL